MNKADDTGCSHSGWRDDVNRLLHSRVVVPDHVLVRELQGESIILNLHNEQYVGLDQVATVMWAALADAESIDAARAELVEFYDVSDEVLTEDLGRFLTRLVDRDLVTVIETDAVGDAAR
ncbi:MAG: PqqD family protein [Acidimicrobiia bacterium]|nr:PqqD family protein [Acidimicrobiia bacterium]